MPKGYVPMSVTDMSSRPVPPLLGKAAESTLTIASKPQKPWTWTADEAIQPEQTQRQSSSTSSAAAASSSTPSSAKPTQKPTPFSTTSQDAQQSSPAGASASLQVQQPAPLETHPEQPVEPTAKAAQGVNQSYRLDPLRYCKTGKDVIVTIRPAVKTDIRSLKMHVRDDSSVYVLCLQIPYGRCPWVLP